MKHIPVGVSTALPSKRTNSITKALCLLLSLAMLLSITAGLDLSAYAATSGDYEYNVLEDGTIEITRYNGSNENLVIPSFIDDRQVSSISSVGSDNVVISPIKSITIPSSITNIKYGALQFCMNLNEIIVDSANESYSAEDGVLFNKDKTELIYCSGALNSSRTQYVVPDSVIRISELAFTSGYLSNLCLGANVRYIDDRAFSFVSLQYINVNSNNQYFTVDNNVLFSSDKTELVLYPSGYENTSYVIPEGVTYVKPAAFFYSCINEIFVPDSIKCIHANSFAGCINLTTVTLPNGLTDIETDAFLGSQNLENVYYNGTKEQWDNIVVDESNDELLNATIHCTDGIINEKGHIHSYTVEETMAPTCTSTGRKTYTCTECGEIKNEIIPKKTHTYIAEVTPPTCTKQGYTTYTCECGYSYIDDYVDVTVHTPKVTQDAVAPTCDTVGYTQEIKCSVCDEVIEARTEITATGHTVVTDNAVPATCTESGLAEGSHCSVCNTVFVEQEIIPATGHTPKVTQEAVTPTCDTAGYTREVKCSVCGDVVESKTEISAIGHTIVTDNAVTATCTESGLSQGSHCSVCNTVFVEQETIPATGHTWNSGKITKSSTCTAIGTKTYTCTVCSETKTETIPKKAHTYKAYVTKATTKKNGSIVTKCSVCGAIKSKSTIYYPKTITLSATSYVYSGKVKKPAVTVKNSNGKTISSSNYTVSYQSGRKNVAKYTVTIKFKGNYSGTVKKTFTIKPKATSISTLTAKSKGFTVKWKKQATQTTGYQIQYSTSSKFKSAKTVTVTKNSTTSKTIAKLKAKKKYYVRIRTYKTVNGKKYYSTWSKTKTVKTK